MKPNALLPALAALLCASCASVENSRNIGEYTITFRNEFPTRILTPVVRYPGGYERGGIAFIPPGVEAGYVGVNQRVPVYATIFWREPDSTANEAVVDVLNVIPRGRSGGEIVFTIRPDREVTVSYRDFQ